MKDEAHLSSDVGPRLTRVEYWLLGTALEYSVSLPSVASPTVEEFYNKDGHGATSKLLAEALANLFTRRWIYAIGPDSNEFYPAAEEIEAMFQPLVISGYDQLSIKDQIAADKIASEKMIHYRLTPEGGRQWELFAHPNWDMYITHSGGWGVSGREQRKGEIICPRKCHVEYFLEEVGTIGEQIVEGTIEWDVLTPWEATYWKELPKAYRVRYMFIEESDWDWTGVSFHIMDYIHNRHWCTWQ
jgi:hypothetical protein